MPPSCCRCCPAALHHPACGWWGACSSLVGGAAGQDRGKKRAGGRRAVSAVPEARHPGPAGRRDCSSALSHACFGLRRSATSGALFCPHCRPAPGTHRPSCAQVGLRRGACDLPPALPPPVVGPRAQMGRGAAVYESLSTRCLVHACKMRMVCWPARGRAGCGSRRGSAGGPMGQRRRPSRSVLRAVRWTCCVCLRLVSARHFPHSILIMEASRLRSVGLGRNTRGMRMTWRSRV